MPPAVAAITRLMPGARGLSINANPATANAIIRTAQANPTSGSMPLKLSPGTPSMLAGSRMPCQ
ncbi:hypothetical protein AN403_5486 [Pseudomonas fluorescens]|uniref:Uncharacterized protein n=1 Tax=Pseudomonas fluorescens TaxID=294 RepID=A0A0P9BER2_PSEFL|nr:hypothetical protein AN403_5486 [Pseudomonas fluorescens]